MTNPNSLDWAKQKDALDPLSKFRQEFVFPKVDGQDVLYFAGHSLGLMPKRTQQAIANELNAWGEFGVEAHFKSKIPWVSYHEVVAGSLARLVGAKESEVVAMNSLTVNLHLMMTSFYRPHGQRTKF
jgi:kynureninase